MFVDDNTSGDQFYTTTTGTNNTYWMSNPDLEIVAEDAELQIDGVVEVRAADGTWRQILDDLKDSHEEDIRKISDEYEELLAETQKEARFYRECFKAEQRANRTLQETHNEEMNNSLYKLRLLYATALLTAVVALGWDEFALIYEFLIG